MIGKARLSAYCLLLAAAPLAAGTLPGTNPGTTDPGSPGGNLMDPHKVLDFGFGLQIDRPYQAPGERADATVFFFNMTPWDADGAWSNFGGFGCNYTAEIRNARGEIVWRPAVFCPAMSNMPPIVAMPFPFPAGTLLQLPAPLEMVYQWGETPDPDGEPLPGGPYTLEARHDYHGPVLPTPDGGSTGNRGSDPWAVVPFRVVLCDGAGGTVPFRDLGGGDYSGYRYGDMNFYGEDLVLRTKEAAQAFWIEHASNQSPPPSPPAVDFRTEMVLVTLLGWQSSGGGPSIEIRSVDESPCHITVLVQRDTDPGPLDVITNPFHAVAVPRSLKEVRFVHTVVFGPDGAEED